MKEEQKLCVYCEHIAHTNSIYYSTLTGGESACIECLKSHFSDSKIDIDSLRGWAQRAETCPDYQLDKTVNLNEKT